MFKFKKAIYLLVTASLIFGSLSMVSVASPLTQGKTYTVQKDDNLWMLAEKYLGNGAAYPAIVDATNKKAGQDESFAKIRNPSLIQPGWKLWIPTVEEATAFMETYKPLPPRPYFADMDLETFAQEADINWRQFEGTTLNFAMDSFFVPDYMKENQLPVFEELTGIKVNWETVPQDDLYLKTQTEMASGAGNIDLFAFPIQFTYQYSPYLEPLNGYLSNPELTDAEWYDFEGFNPGLIKASTFDGNIYALPISLEATMLFYRKDLFEAKGLEVPQTYDELMEAAKALHNPPETIGIAMRGRRGQISYVFAGFFRGFGGKWFKDFPTDLTPTVNTPEGVAALEFYGDILRNYGPEGVANWGWDDCQAAMLEGNVAMVIDASDFVFQIEDPAKSKTAGKWGYSVVPSGPAGRYPAFLSWYYAINKNSRNKGAAWLFLQFLTSPLASYQRVNGERSNLFRWQGLEEPLVNYGTEYATALNDSFALGDPDYRPRFAKYQEWNDAIGVAVQSVLSGQLDAQTALDQAQQRIAELVSQ